MFKGTGAADGRTGGYGRCPFQAERA